MRLIDADAFIEYLGLDAENAREDNVGEIVTLEDFDRQPTAFDKDKVIDELKSAENYLYVNGIRITNFKFIHTLTAIEIVEKGGIE